MLAKWPVGKNPFELLTLPFRKLRRTNQEALQCLTAIPRVPQLPPPSSRHMKTILNQISLPTNKAALENSHGRLFPHWKRSSVGPGMQVVPRAKSTAQILPQCFQKEPNRLHFDLCSAKSIWLNTQPPKLEIIAECLVLCHSNTLKPDTWAMDLKRLRRLAVNKPLQPCHHAEWHRRCAGQVGHRTSHLLLTAPSSKLSSETKSRAHQPRTE